MKKRRVKKLDSRRNRIVPLSTKKRASPYDIKSLHVYLCTT